LEFQSLETVVNKALKRIVALAGYSSLSFVFDNNGKEE
jgi:hypothetical protein